MHNSSEDKLLVQVELFNIIDTSIVAKSDMERLGFRRGRLRSSTSNSIRPISTTNGKDMKSEQFKPDTRSIKPEHR